jgi:hypothetical protein
MRWILALGLCLWASWAQAQSFSIPVTQFSVSITGTVGTQQVIPPIAGLRGYITHIALIPVATSTVQFTAGTGATCGTGTVNLTGVMTFAAGQVLPIGSGNGGILTGPLNAGICIVIGVAAAPGAIGAAQF